MSPAIGEDVNRTREGSVRLESREASFAAIDELPANLARFIFGKDAKAGAIDFAVNVFFQVSGRAAGRGIVGRGVSDCGSATGRSAGADSRGDLHVYDREHNKDAPLAIRHAALTQTLEREGLVKGVEVKPAIEKELAALGEKLKAYPCVWANRQRYGRGPDDFEAQDIVLHYRNKPAPITRHQR